MRRRACDLQRRTRWERGGTSLEGRLGKLVTFTRRERTAEPVARPGGAEILMFTGVRYERSGLPKAGKRSDPGKPKRKRG